MSTTNTCCFLFFIFKFPLFMYVVLCSLFGFAFHWIVRGKKSDVGLRPSDLRKNFHPTGFLRKNYILFWPHHSVNWGINPSSFKNTNSGPPIFLPSPPLNLLSQCLLFRQCPLYIGLSWIPRKTRIFWLTPKILKFFIFHSNLSFKSNQLLTEN